MFSNVAILLTRCPRMRLRTPATAVEMRRRRSVHVSSVSKYSRTVYIRAKLRERETCSATQYIERICMTGSRGKELLQLPQKKKPRTQQVAKTIRLYLLVCVWNTTDCRMAADTGRAKVFRGGKLEVWLVDVKYNVRDENLSPTHIIWNNIVVANKFTAYKETGSKTLP